jgi:ferrous iron transport protein A
LYQDIDKHRCVIASILEGQYGEQNLGNHPVLCSRELRLKTAIRVKAAGELGRRIRDMGLVPGTEIRVQGRAPLYDPVALRIRGFTLTLRNKEADYIEVEVE